MLAPRSGRHLPLPVWTELIAQYLNRDQSPLRPQAWRDIDRAVAEAAGAARVARRFLPLHQAFGPGIKAAAANPDAWKDPNEKGGLTLPIILRDTHLSTAGPADTLPALALQNCIEAAVFCATVEDSLVFNGHPDLGYAGLLTAPGRQVNPRGHWLTSPAAAIAADVYAAAGSLENAGCGGPYVLVVGPDLEPAVTNPELPHHLAVMVPELTLHVCPALPEQATLLVAPRSDYMDLAVAQDLITGYMGRQNGLHCLRVFAILALRIKHPGAICALELSE